MNLCIKGHDKEIVGKTKNRHCAECTRIAVKRHYHNNCTRLRARNRAYYQNHKVEARDSGLKRRYGITLGDYNRLFRTQNGCCKICNIHQLNLKKKLVVDHNHQTKRVRGLLCHKCNFLIGQANDSIVILKQAIRYLS